MFKKYRKIILLVIVAVSFLFFANKSEISFAAENCCVYSDGKCDSNISASLCTAGGGIFKSEACSKSPGCKSSESDGCCVVSPNNCLGTAGKTCVHGDFQPKKCSEIAICSQTSSGGGAIKFENPLDFDTVEGFLGNFLSYIQAIIVTLALVFIVVGAVLYVTSAGSAEQTKWAKNAILAAMIGLAIAIAAPSFLKEIADILDWGGEKGEAVEQALTLSQIALNLLSFLLSIIGVLSIVMIVIGGIFYFTVAADPKQADTAKDIIKYAIVGLIVALIALVIVKQIATLFT